MSTLSAWRLSKASPFALAGATIRSVPAALALFQQAAAGFRGRVAAPRLFLYAKWPAWMAMNRNEQSFKRDVAIEQTRFRPEAPPDRRAQRRSIIKGQRRALRPADSVHYP